MIIKCSNDECCDKNVDVPDFLLLSAVLRNDARCKEYEGYYISLLGNVYCSKKCYIKYCEE